MRVACLGDGFGYYQVYPKKLKRWDIPRHYFKDTTVDAQIDSAVRLLECDSQELICSGPVPELHEIALDAGHLAQFCRNLSQELRAYVH